MSVRVQKNIAALMLVVAASVAMALPALASMQTAISLTAAPSIIAADGKSTTVITATVRGGDGNLVPDNSPVQFSATSGTLERSTAVTSSGAARVTLTSAPTTGLCQITATYFDTTGGGGAGKAVCTVEFTNDRDLESTDGNSRWLRIDCPEYLVYSADAKMIQAEGSKGSAHLKYKSFSIDADSIQVDVQEMSVVARNATLHHGRASLETAELRYDLYTSTGTAVLPATDTKAPESVTVTGTSFDTVALSAAAADEAVRNHVYGETDLSSSRLVVSARAISVDPGAQIQFTRAAIYSDGKKIVAMPYHVMPLSTNQLFGEQIVGYSSGGIFLNIPYYYHVSPDSMGTIYIRNSAAAEANISSGLAPTFGASGTRPGLAIDLQHTYAIGSSGSGTLVLNGLTRSDWGGYWNHTQRIDPATSSYFYVDYPEHRGIYGTSNIRHDLRGGYSLNMQASESITPGFEGYSSSSSILNTFLSTPAWRLGKSPLDMTAGLTWNQGIINSTVPGYSTVTTPVSTQGANLRFFTSPIKPDKQTVISDSLAVGGSYSHLSGQESMTMQGSFGATRTLPKNGQLALTYNYTYDPLLNYTQPATAATPYAEINSPLQQTLSLTGNFNPSKKSVLSLSSSYALPGDNISMFGFYSYRVDNDWGIGLNALYERTFFTQFSSLELSVTRRILGRTVIFSYGTDTHRIRFDFGAGQF